jgi:hypothetical protein
VRQKYNPLTLMSEVRAARKHLIRPWGRILRRLPTSWLTSAPAQLRIMCSSPGWCGRFARRAEEERADTALSYASDHELGGLPRAKRGERCEPFRHPSPWPRPAVDEDYGIKAVEGSAPPTNHQSATDNSVAVAICSCSAFLAQQVVCARA